MDFIFFPSPLIQSIRTFKVLILVEEGYCKAIGGDVSNRCDGRVYRE